MKRRALALFIMLCLLFNTVGRDSLAIAQGDSFLRSFSSSKDEGGETKGPGDRGLVRKITTSDGATYDIEVTYKENAGIPMEGVELLVSEILPGDEGYDFYLGESAKKVGTEADSLSLTRVFDITIADAKDHSVVYEPNADVSVSIRLVGSSLEDYENVDVLHFEEKTETKRSAEEFSAEAFTVDEVKSTVNGESVEFTTDSFSVYVIIGHEGGETVETPRFTIHFIAPVADGSETNVNGVFQYTSAPYEFVNTAGGRQTTQIVCDSETIELIANPPNRADKFFYGWYVVNAVSQDDNGITFQWTDSPKKLSFESPVGVTDNGDGTFTMSWSTEGIDYTETAAVDRTDYSAHLYVAPIYEDYCFVNFHEVAYVVSTTGNLLTRKLVILGDDATERALVSDVMAPSTDTIRRIFRGWMYRAGNTSIFVQTIDNHNDPMVKYIDVTQNVDLYPYFQEGRWLYFNVGDSGNGAKYIPARFELAEFNSQDGGATIGGTLTSLPVTERVGYDFGGWRVITGYENDDPKKPIYELVTDENGNFLTDVDISVSETYLDNDNVERTGTAFTVKDGTLTLKYPLSKLTFYAQWNEKANTTYTVVIWKQKDTDPYNSATVTNADKHYDYYVLDTRVLPTVVNSASGRDLNALLAAELDAYTKLRTNAGTTADFTGFVYNRAEMSSDTVRGDGSTVVNVYYDRVAYELKFIFARRNRNSGQFQVPALGNGTFARPNTQTWEAYCTTNGTGHPVWSDITASAAGTICTAGNVRSMLDSSGTYEYYYYFINANYGTNVSGVWPDYDSYPQQGQYRLSGWWIMAGSGIMQAGNAGDTVKGKISTIDKQILGLVDEPDGNFLIASYRGSNNNVYNWTYNIYLEVLEGADYTGKTVVTHNNKQFYLADSFIARSSNQELRQQNPPAYEGFSFSDKTGAYPNADFYYNRGDATFTFDYHYPTSVGMGIKTVDIPGVWFDTLLDKFNHKTHPEDPDNAVWPSDEEIPEHYEFLGWYEDAEGNVPFDFGATMPAADKIVYGKWQPVYYTISIDPAGGTIDHINYDAPTDGEYPTFNLAGFKEAINGGIAAGTPWEAAFAAIGNNSDTAWIDTLLGISDGHNTAHSTYFSAMYGTAIGQYELERAYVECDSSYTGDVYYYVNMQFAQTNSQWGFHADLRNALYLTEEQLAAYYTYCKAAQAWHDAARPDYYDAVLPGTFEEFKETYVKKSGSNFSTYKKATAADYDFVGWYVVDKNGNLSENPYNFANIVEDVMKLQGVWRRVGNFYIAYDTVYKIDDSTIISGSIPAWTDPDSAAVAKYTDGAYTTTTQQPTDIMANGQPAEDDYIFRGWRIVKIVGYDGDGMPIYEALSDTYYDAAVPFVINSDYADENECIHLQAVYQAVNSSDRRPKVANLVLNANGGFLVRADGTEIAATDSDVTITSLTGWKVGRVVEDASEQEIVFGDMQSNDAVHLYQFAVKAGMLDAPYDESRSFFEHRLGYLLLGFDEGSDYSLDTTPGTDDDLKTGEAFIPTYAADSVISVHRTDNERLFAVWEPMVYVTFTNRTSETVTFELSSNDVDTMSIVNEVTGIFDREKFTDTSVTLAAGESIKFVMPRGAEKQFTVQGVNTSTSQLLTVSSYFREQLTGQSVAGLNRSAEAEYDLTDTLHDDEVGVLVYFDGMDTVFYDVNDTIAKPAVWTDSRTGASLSEVVGSSTLVYVDEDGLPYEAVDLSGGAAVKATEPSKPTRNGFTFVGWTDNKEVAECNPAAYTLPGTDEAGRINNLAVIKNNYLWDFDTEITEGMTLYAVWGETVTVTFRLYGTQVWNSANDTEYYVPGTGNTHVVTLAKGDTVAMPAAPTWNNNATFYRWVNVNSYQTRTEPVSSIAPTAIFNFGTPVEENLDLYTSWIDADSITVTVSKNVVDGTAEDLTEDFAFTVRITTRTYTASVTRSGTYWVNWNVGNVIVGNDVVEEQTFTLKHGETYEFPLYYHEDSQTISSNTTITLTTFYQFAEIVEASDPRFITTYTNNGQASTFITAPRLNNPSGNTRTYTLIGAANTGDAEVDFTNTRTHTDVKVTKVVTPDDYLTGDEEFSFTATYQDRDGRSATPAEADGYTVDGDTVSFTLGDGETVLLRGVPIGGSVTVTEAMAGFAAESVCGTVTGNETFTLESVSAEEIAEITFTNTREVYEVTVGNEVLPGEYTDPDKAFLYSATLWNGTEQAVFPSTLENTAQMTVSGNRKDMQIVLKSGESVVIEGLPGNYRLEVTQTEDEDYITESKVSGYRRGIDVYTEDLTATLDPAEYKRVDFRNTLKTGSYTITKSVHLEEGQTIPADTRFNFTAVLLSSAEDTTPEVISQAIIDALPSDASVNGATIEFTLEDGGSITLSELPVGYFLQVKELAVGYVAYVSGNRQDSVTSQIAEGDNGAINFTNRKSALVLTLRNVDASVLTGIPGSVFTLSKRVGNQTETLYTLTADADGLLTAEDAGVAVSELELENGTYYLSEVTPGVGYRPISDTVRIVVDTTKENDAEKIALYVGEEPAGAALAEVILPPTEADDRLVYTVHVKSQLAIPAPTGYHADMTPYLLILLAGLVILSWLGFAGKKRKVRS